jgi:hypothetical protein
MMLTQLSQRSAACPPSKPNRAPDREEKAEEDQEVRKEKCDLK